ncbi:MAG TPA: CHAT domain-containing protein, partial [Dongiaceae bacterium]|nr:CHAT domain-containing protein [Dongiaceae bacterium]
LELRAGNLSESLDLAQRAVELTHLRSGDNTIGTAYARITVAYRLEALGDYEAGARELRSVLPVLDARIGPTNPRTITARLDLTQNLLASGDTVAARAVLDEVRPALAQQEAVASQNRSALRKIEADLELAAGHVAAARESLALALADELPQSSGAPGGAFELLAAGMGTVRAPADSAYADGLRRSMNRLGSSTSARLTPEWIGLVNARAAAEWRVGLRDSAWADALEAESLARRRLTFALQGLSDRHALGFAQQLDAPCEMLVAMTAARPEGASVTWDRIVRWRGLVAHEIARRRLPERARVDTTLAALRDDWLAAQRTLAQLVVSGAASPDDPTTAERFAAARSAAEERERRYVRVASGGVPPDDSVSLARVLGRLGKGQALVAFATGSVESREPVFGAFVAAADRSVRFVKLGDPALLGTRVRAWIATLSHPPVSDADARRAESAARRLGAGVRAAVWDPLRDALGGAGEIFLVPEGPVDQLPWLALPARDGYLADDARTLRVLDAERELLAPAAAPGGSGLLAVGGPDFDGPPAASTTPGPPTVALALRARSWPCAGGPVTLPALPMARAEAEDLVKSWPASAGRAELLTGADAREATFRRLAPGHALIHIATHGVMVGDTCETASRVDLRGVGGVTPIGKARAGVPAPAAPARRRSSPWLARQVWLAFSGANQPPGSDPDDDGLLTAEEVSTLDLRGVDWVVLSACQTGVAPAWENEGVLGMRRAFRLAGVHTVIASQWPVADAATRTWMNALYRAREHETSAGAAVRRACADYLAAERRAGHATFPFYWAAFTATGE